MIFTAVLTLVLASLVINVLGQDDTQGPIVYDAVHNMTSIYGTWSSGSQHVVTGPAFANPANMTFFYPKTTGVSYSFSPDGHYEIARYRFTGNGSEPTCITGVIGWVHGTYTLNTNGSITMVALPDGYQQIQDPCAAQSNFIESYSMTEYYKGWRIFQDPTAGYKLHLFMWDGAPVAPMFQISATPNMLPTRMLRNVTTDAVQLSRRSTSSAKDSSPRWTIAALSAAGFLIFAAPSVL